MRTGRATPMPPPRPPRGHLPADGRTLGLGLATAMEAQRRNSTREVEDYLRTTPPERVKTTA